MKKKLILLFLVSLMLIVALIPVGALAAPDNSSCWGQATAVFAQIDEMGEHASQQPTPRLGLRNLARVLADIGVIPDDSMRSLGAFVATELGLTVEACMD